MKRILFILVVALCAATSSIAQSGFRTQTANGLPSQDEVSTSQISLHNAWIGSSFSYQVTGEDELSDNFLFDVNLLYDIDFNGFHVPVAGNLSFPINTGELTNVEVGVYPWKVVATANNGGVLVAHGGVSYKQLTSQGEDDSTPQTIRALLGVEYSMPLGQNNLPLTASVTPVFQTEEVVTGTENFFSLEGTFIVPIAANLGFLGEVVVPLNGDGLKTTFNAGIIVNGAIGG